MTHEELIRALNFNLGLIAATESLLYAAGMPERIAEEANHAKWLASDIQKLGGVITAYDYDAAAIAGAQYYHIFHVSPKMLLGYMAALECNIMDMQQLETLEAQFGQLPCLRHHVTNDIAHGQWVLSEIDKVADERLYGLIMGNRRWTESAIRQVLEARLRGTKEEVHA